MRIVSAHLLIALAVSTCTTQAQQRVRTVAEQTHFTAEADRVDHPVPIPREIRRFLAKDEMVRDAAQAEGIASEGFPDSWFLTSAIHLGPSPKADYVLVGRGPMLGANITQFWVFCAEGDGYRLVLQGGAHDLLVTHRIWNGYREIDLVSMTGMAEHDVNLRYESGRYKPYRDVWQSTQ